MPRGVNELMDFLGIKIKSRGIFNGKDDWTQIPEHTYCPADTTEKQIECREYVPVGTGDWLCKFCNGDWCKKCNLISM